MQNKNIYNGDPIKTAMDEQDLSVQDVAKKSGLSRPTVYEVLDGKNVRIKTLSDVANAVNVPMDELFKEESAA